MDHSVWIVTQSISAEEISGIYFILNVVKRRIITIGDDASAHFLELLEVVDNLRTEECAAVFQRRFVDDNGSAFSFNAFHDTLDAALPEIVTITLHCKTIDTDDDLLLFIWIEILASSVCASNFKDSLSDEILPGPIAFYDGNAPVRIESAEREPGKRAPVLQRLREKQAEVAARYGKKASEQSREDVSMERNRK